MRITQQQFVQGHFGAYAEQVGVSDRERRAAHAIAVCGTRELGAHVLSCPQGQCEQLQFHACRHRSCARCAAVARQRWAEQELARLLPGPHHHVVFTLPHELLELWTHNRAAMTTLLMRSSQQALLQVLCDPRHLGALPGIVQSLHTWGRTLSQHPHVHCLVSAGGVDEAGRWRACRPGWFVPVQALRTRYKAALLAGIGHGLAHGWSLPEGSDREHWPGVLRQLWRQQHWNIEIGQRYEHGRGVVLYLARYAKGCPLPRSRPLEYDDGHIAFEYRDHHDGQTKTMRLAAMEFMRRLLWHVPAPRQHTTRHAGLYNSNARQQYAQAREQLQHSAMSWPRPRAEPAKPPTLCPHCGLAMLRVRRLSGLNRPLKWHQGGAFAPQSRDSGGGAQGRGPTWRSTGPPTARHRGREAAHDYDAPRGPGALPPAAG
jgi:hypothetical protein